MVQQPGRDRLAAIRALELRQVLPQLGVLRSRRLHAPVHGLPILVHQALLQELHLLGLVEVAEGSITPLVFNRPSETFFLPKAVGVTVVLVAYYGLRLLTDLGLPDIDGCEATRRLKADPNSRHIPVIALSAHAA